MTNNATPFGTTADGKQASLVTLTNAAGLEASFSDYGATWVSMITPDRAHQLADVLIGFDDVTGMKRNLSFLASWADMPIEYLRDVLRLMAFSIN